MGTVEARERELCIILADISGYTRFMVENQQAAVHGQLCITALIETMLREVDIPLELQEIEGDALFLFAAHPGDDAGWQDVLSQVRSKLPRFFSAFFAAMIPATEATPCGCAICTNLDQLKLKVIVHVGRAVFHEIAGRRQISGTDVILAHRLLKNSLPDREYLLLTEPAHRDLGRGMDVEFDPGTENCEGFGSVRIYVQSLEQKKERERGAFRALPRRELARRVRAYGIYSLPSILRAQARQLRRPFFAASWPRRLAFALYQLAITPFMITYIVLVQPHRVRARHRAELREETSRSAASR